jgi:hypothetical protein
VETPRLESRSPTVPPNVEAGEAPRPLDQPFRRAMWTYMNSTDSRISTTRKRASLYMSHSA